MSKEWCACFIVDTVIPRETNSGISAVINVVFPLPLQPARPKTRIVAPSIWAQLGDAHRRRNGLGQMLRLAARRRRPRARHVAQSSPQIVVSSHQGEDC